ncbi:hypothetical protein COP2_022826 [Malus domestica]
MGLSFGEFPLKENDDDCHLRDIDFRRKKKITLKQLEEQFNMCQHLEDRYKFGLMYFTHFVVLGKEKESTIDHHLLQLVEDEEKWERYP